MMLSSIAVAAVCLGTGTAPHVSIPYEKYVLEENGLTVILSEEHSLPIVAINLWYYSGPINEPPGRSGFAHLFEHLMFRGSRDVPPGAFFALLTAAGASDANGSTGWDATNYFETVPKTELELALWLESDRMGFLLDGQTQAGLDREREVVMNERRESLEEQPYGRSDEQLIKLLFPEGHPYHGYIIGSMKDLAAATLADVREFYWRYYAPANASLVVAGDIDVRETKALVARYFGTLPPRPPPPRRAVLTPPITAERRAKVVEPVELPRLAYGWLSPPAFAPGDATADVLSIILAGGRSSRLYRRLVYELELCQSVSALQESQALASIFSITVTAMPGADLTRVEAELEAALAGIVTHPPDAVEIERAKNLLYAGMMRRLQSLGESDGKADTLNRYEMYLGDPGFVSRDLDRHETVDAQALASFAEQVLSRSARAVVVTVPR